ncbi:DUF2339 domain-containing protein [Mesorhizobium sp. L-8-3]|uniref:DUF2339 domain-containing protein n=1 Tax=Mesorhizobium sp. L-8-3 TaxID=2744522 RepID=UPI001928C6E1|nr:DUF2339 domain-containing protein [Mesorhizobium sp. L-8-3]BCH25887.1 hypothetical protein MesoLjLb_56720 [Mesorhizobium sp. L-8-3]
MELGIISLVAVIVLFAVVVRQQKRITVLEFDLEGLRKAFLANREAMLRMAPPATEAASAEPATALPDDATKEAMTAMSEAAPGEREKLGQVEAADAQAPAEPGPWSRPHGEQLEAVPAAAAKKPDIETALGTRWAVWVGGLALALGGIFLVRYSIEAGIFGPGVRLTMAALFGLILVGGGEFIRRTGFRLPAEGLQSAYVPAILTAAGAFTLFGTVYAAHGIYGFIGPGSAFVLLGLIGVGTIAAALVHGQALGGVGLVGSYLTPLLVASEAPNHWALFGFLAIVLVASGVIARLRDWAPLMTAAFAGSGLWSLLYLASFAETDLTILLFIGAVTLGVLVFIWLRGRAVASPHGFDIPSIAPAVFVGLTALALAVDPRLSDVGGMAVATVLIAGLLGVACYRRLAIPALFGAGAAAALAYAYVGLGGRFLVEFSSGSIAFEGTSPAPFGATAVRYGIMLALVFVAAGLWGAWRFAGAARIRAVAWAGWGVAVPLAVLAATWIAFGNLDQDYSFAGSALLLAAVLVAGAEWVARAERPPLAGGPAVSVLLSGAGAATLLMFHMALGGGWTTLALGVVAAVPAYATRFRSYPVLGWLSVATAVAVLGRMAFDPTIVGEEFLGTTPVFNRLLPGYGVPALGAAYAAWQLARTTNGRPRLAMEGFASLFAMLGVAMLVRHAMNGGVIDAGAPMLAEQSIYTLIAIGGGAILISLDLRSPSPVFRYGSLALGVLSVASIVLQHFANLNPVYTDESTGGIPIVNLLLLGYLLPCLATAALAWLARGKRPHWYVAMLAVVAAMLGFAYATLSVRRLFHGEFIGLWKGFTQLETYSYSALWLAMGVVLLAAGVRLGSQALRIASAGLVVIAVAKVFLLDMSELEGVLRALSFIGLGAVLIGIGLFYQRMLAAAAK